MKVFKGLLFLVPQLVLAADTWRGIQYPMNRWGISVMGVNQVEKGNLTSAGVKGKLGKNKLDINVDFLKPQDLRVDADVKIVKVDYFVLPFLNVYAIGGELDANVKFNLGKGDVKFGKTGKPFIDAVLEGVEKDIATKMPANIKIEHKAEGKLYGGGALIAGEYKRVFTSLQYTYTRIEMDGDVAAKSAEVGMAKVGYVAYRESGYSITPYVGAAYQKTDSSISGPIPVELEGVSNLNYKFTMELEKVTPSIGIFTVLNDRFTVLVDYSFGDRETLAIDLGYRF
ncbi:MAG: hypothetical protein ACRCZ9_10625 [Fusobacteriaceae bacterium]